ncbi:hemagglutinin repeat-containing protein [Dialister micraerophilus]|uniref:hemagglutinin repeat-containing protein n=1 Tax=Dialister micraerophilus TaxID=309120 RepID=UPI003B8A5DD3
MNSNKNINIISKENTTTREIKTKNENKQIGAAVGIQGVQGINLSYMQNKGNEKEIIQTHTMCE